MLVQKLKPRLKEEFVQISVNKFFFYLFILVLLSNCSIGKKEISENQKKIEDIFEKPTPIEKQLNPNLKIQLKKITRGESFLRNDSNNSGNINFESDFKKINSYKF